MLSITRCVKYLLILKLLFKMERKQLYSCCNDHTEFYSRAWGEKQNIRHPLTLGQQSRGSYRNKPKGEFVFHDFDFFENFHFPHNFIYREIFIESCYI